MWPWAWALLINCWAPLLQGKIPHPGPMALLVDYTLGPGGQESFHLGPSEHNHHRGTSPHKLKAPGPTVHLTIAPEQLPPHLKNYPPEVLSHFWLIPQVGNLLHTQIKKWARARGRPIKNPSPPYPILSFPPFPRVILSHLGPRPLFEQTSPTVVVIPPRHEELRGIRPSTLKAVVGLLAPGVGPVLWALDPHNPLPPTLLAKRRSFDLTVEVDTQSARDQTPQGALLGLKKQLDHLWSTFNLRPKASPVPSPEDAPSLKTSPSVSSPETSSP